MHGITFLCILCHDRGNLTKNASYRREETNGEMDRVKKYMKFEDEDGDT